MEKVDKCPACGAMRDSMSGVCPDCGYAFKDVEVAQSLQKFAEKIENYDALIVVEEGLEEKKGAGVWTVLGWIFLFPIMFGIYLFKKAKEQHEELTGTSKLKSEAIMNYPIPNSKNDLTEFIIFTESKMKPINYINALTKSGANIQKWNRIWKNKAEQIKKKAAVSLSDDKLAVRKIDESYQAMETRYKENEKIQWIMLGVLAAAFVVLIIFAAIGDK